MYQKPLAELVSSRGLRAIIFIVLTLATAAMLTNTMFGGIGVGTTLVSFVSTSAALGNNVRTRFNQELQRILDQAFQEPLYTYPTSITQDIVPKACYSHNDYWRPVPFYSALSNGCYGIEADVWLVDGTLYVSHEQAGISPARTLQSLYLDPILSVLNSTNPNTQYMPPEARNGVFDVDSTLTLYFVIDIKSDGAETYPAVVEALEPLRAGGWLSSVNTDGIFVERPITAIGGGRTPRELVEAAVPRDVFYDAVLGQLEGVTSLVARTATTKFRAAVGDVRGTQMNNSQLATLRSQIDEANAAGILPRYWDTPGWPIATRDAVWRTLWDMGVGFLNVDDVDAVATVVF